MIPTVCRIVLYSLTAQDAKDINKRRKDASMAMSMHRTSSNGVMVHVGSTVKEHDQYPLVITRVFGLDETTEFNGQVLLDGNDTLWIANTKIGIEAGECQWPPRV